MCASTTENKTRPFLFDQNEKKRKGKKLEVKCWQEEERGKKWEKKWEREWGCCFSWILEKTLTLEKKKESFELKRKRRRVKKL